MTNLTRQQQQAIQRVINGNPGLRSDLTDLSDWILGFLTNPFDPNARNNMRRAANRYRARHNMPLLPEGNSNGNGNRAIRQIRNAPAAIGVTRRNPAPRFNTTAGGRYVITNSEFVSDVKNSQGFKVSQFTIQPGVDSVFPWLSVLANSYQKYRVRYLRFKYVPLASTGERGRVTMCYARDPLDPVPLNKVELSQYPNAEHCAIWTPNQLNCQLNPADLFVRRGEVPNTDLKTYDNGQLFIATDGGQDSQRIGELYVEYSIELSIPKPTRCPSDSFRFKPSFLKAAPLNTPLRLSGQDSSIEAVVNLTEVGADTVNGFLTISTRSRRGLLVTTLFDQTPGPNNSVNGPDVEGLDTVHSDTVRLEPSGNLETFVHIRALSREENSTVGSLKFQFELEVDGPDDENSGIRVLVADWDPPPVNQPST